MREQWPSCEGKRKLVSPRLFGDQKKFKQWQELRPVSMEQISSQVIEAVSKRLRSQNY